MYILFSASSDGKILGEIPNPAVSEELLLEISHMMRDGICWNDIVNRLRPRTVPAGYAFCSWMYG